MASYVAKLLKLAESAGLKAAVEEAGLQDTPFERGVIIRVETLSAMEIEDLKTAIKHALGKKKHVVNENEEDEEGKVYEIAVYFYRPEPAKKASPKKKAKTPVAKKTTVKVSTVKVSKGVEIFVVTYNHVEDEQDVAAFAKKSDALKFVEKQTREITGDVKFKLSKAKKNEREPYCNDGDFRWRISKIKLL